MVDFRYHLVSLISVFFALAIGIILGAGPLQNSIGNVLQGQVADLRVTNEQLKADKSSLAHVTDSQSQAFNELAPSLINGKLAGRRAALVVLPGVPQAQVSDVRAKLELAGATMTGQATVTDAWTLASQTSFRSTFADQIRTYVPGVADNADTNTILAGALNAIAREGVTKHDTLAGLMTGTDTPMLAVDAMKDPADVVIALAADIDPSKNATKDADAVAQQQYTSETLTALVSEIAARGPAVAVGAANSDGDVVRALRDGGVQISTVDSPELVIGQINVAIAAASALNNAVIHLGIDSGAQSVLGTLELSPVATEGATEAPADGTTEAATEAPADGEATANEETTE
ncbi:copper transporter [Trueperella pecoris]|uniref:Copper transporter n=1 Tax=Trueperella pecoris TaxID=2733571 RepID=A0A7M1QXU4_9ACTO|nr:copper transporter [Trueperella pecoris]QOR46758.1 copper transporter [Trueperella pecoris]